MSNICDDNSDIQELVELESKFIDEKIIQLVKKYSFIYDQSEPVEGDRNDLIENTFDYIASKISNSDVVVYHELTGT